VDGVAVALRAIDRGGAGMATQVDLATANQDADALSILLGDGTGHFASTQEIGVGDHPLFVAAGDWNGDGRQDLATANFDTSAISILLNAAARDRTRWWAATPSRSAPTAGGRAGGRRCGRQAGPRVGGTGGNTVTSCATRATQLLEPRPRQDAGHAGRPPAGDFNGDGTPDLVTANSTPAR